MQKGNQNSISIWLRKKFDLNHVVILLGLIFLRLPTLLGIREQIWVNILPLVPFWYMIIHNETSNKPTGRSKTVNQLLKFLLTLDLIGVLLLIYMIFAQSISNNASLVIISLRILVLVVMVFGPIYYYQRYQKILYTSNNLLALLSGAIYFILVFIAIIRSSFLRPPDFVLAMQIVTLILYGLSIKKYFIENNKIDLFSRLLVYSLTIYLLVNIILYWLGVNNPNPNYESLYKAVILGYFNIDANRVYFPLAEGINAFGMVAGGALVVNILGLMKDFQVREHRQFKMTISIIGCLAASYCVISTDSRSALLFSLFSILLTVFWPKRFFSWLFILLISFQSITLSLGNQLFEKIPIPETLTRGRQDILSGRPFIWQQAFNELSFLKWDHIFGYGLFGQSNSGIVRNYQHLFESYANKKLIGLHSYILQTIFDIGYVGLVVGLILSYLMIRNASKNISKKNYETGSTMMIGLLIYIFLIGSVSSIPSIYIQELFYFFIIFWVYLI